MREVSIIDTIRQQAQAISDEESLKHVVDQVCDASIVLLGEATHGTQEFYRIRSEISKRLIVKHGFDAIAVEADWPDALRVSLYVQGIQTDMSPSETKAQSDEDTRDALREFERFPQWMWRNVEIVKLVGWLRRHNLQASSTRMVGFFGLDLYSLRRSMDAVVRYLDGVDPEAARQARIRYGCFDHLAQDPQQYGYAATFGLRKDCEDEVVRQLAALTSRSTWPAPDEAAACDDELFYAQQNARVAENAEAYYRLMFQGRDASWNQRDRHMADTLDALRGHIGAKTGRVPKIVVWAHNSHIGDARATEMGEHGQLNLGQLIRENYGSEQTFLLGFTTHAGTVTAASEWDGPAETKTVLPSHPDSVERLLHDSGAGNFFLPLRDPKVRSAMSDLRRLERAIGVLYLPQSERLSHYFFTELAAQFDGIIHIDRTHALRALEKFASLEHEEAAETYPFGI